MAGGVNSPFVDASQLITWEIPLIGLVVTIVAGLLRLSFMAGEHSRRITVLEASVSKLETIHERVTILSEHDVFDEKRRHELRDVMISVQLKLESVEGDVGLIKRHLGI